jgi:hypothetical protein
LQYETVLAANEHFVASKEPEEMKTEAGTSYLSALRVVVFVVVASGSNVLFGPSSARAFVLSVGPMSGYFGGYVCADVVNGNLAVNELVQAYDCNGAPNQQYEFNGFTIYALGGERCLDVPGFDNGSLVVRSNVCNGSATQQWHMDGEIVNSGTAKCLDATKMVNGTPLVVSDCVRPHTPISQQWQMK